MKHYFTYGIIGGGITALYSAYRLIENGTSPNAIALFEKSPRLGGRLLSHSTPAGNLNLGAGRFDQIGHPLLTTLMNKFNIATIPHHAHNPLQAQWLNHHQLTNMLLEVDRAIPSLIFKDYILSRFGDKYIHDLAHSGYATVLKEDMPASEALRILLQHPEFSDKASGNSWYEPKQGFGELINTLTQHLKMLGVSFFLNTAITSVQTNKGKHALVTGTHQGKGAITKVKHLIMATPNLNCIKQQYPDEVASLLSSLESVPLFKSFLGFKEAWWQKSSFLRTNQARITLCTNNTNMGKVYFNQTNNIIWIYNDGRLASRWNNIAQDQDYQQKLTKELAQTTRLNMDDISTPQWSIMKFWPQGVMYWLSERKMRNAQRVKNTLSIEHNVHLVSSGFAQRSGWIEGGLESVEELLGNISIQYEQHLPLPQPQSVVA